MPIRDAAVGVFAAVFAAVALIATLTLLASVAGEADARGGGGTESGGSGTGSAGGGSAEADGYRFPLPAKHTYGDGFGAGRNHGGQDLFAPCGKKLVAANSGKVIKTGAISGYGNVIVISLKGTNIDVLYAHMKRPTKYREGQRVGSGDKVGEVGATGNASGCHLHFEMYKGEFWNGGKTMRNVTKHLKRWDRYS